MADALENRFVAGGSNVQLRLYDNGDGTHTPEIRDAGAAWNNSWGCRRGGDYLQIDVAQVGSTIAGANLSVQIVYT